MKRNDLEGKEIGFWKVGSPISKNGRMYFRCTCICGKQRDISGSVLKSKKSLSCGCVKPLRKHKNLIGMDFGFLHVEESVRIDHHTYYRCSCKCGGSKIVKPSNLINGFVKTCGCHMDVGDHIKDSIENHCVDGTYIPGISRSTINKNNTSGCRGVSFKIDRNKWRAYIKFQRKNIHLGYFDKYEDAVEARKNAEKKYFGKYLDNEN